MKSMPQRNWTIAFCWLIVFHSTVTRADSPTFDPANPPNGYHLVWSDEFSHDPDGLPDPKKWNYEVGFIRNNEVQYYTKGRLENARIEKGQLIIEARKEAYSPPGSVDPTGKSWIANYSSASLETFGKADWQYGRIEVKAKLPSGKGVWPAIWTLGISEKDKSVGWPRCGEIDIMELVGKEPGIIHGTLHYFINGKHASNGGQLSVDRPEDGFHVYSAEWTPDRIDLFVDDKKYVSLDVNKADNDGRNPFHKPHYLILNLALGGSWGGPIDDSIFPQRMTVDYVRIYQKSPSP
jgi:beta-glucanase (GH16 family)